MPYTFLFIMGAFLLVPVCFVGTFIISLIVFPFIHKKRDSELSKKLRITKRILLSLLFSFIAAIVFPFCFLLLGGVVLGIDSMYEWDYWKANGVLDSFRMPLEPPYELLMIDTIDYASIQVWQEESSSKIWGITHYEKRGYLMFGVTSNDYYEFQKSPEDKEWFIFDLNNGDKIIFESEEEFLSTLKKRGIENIQLKTVLQNWNEYWKNPRNKATEKSSLENCN